MCGEALELRRQIGALPELQVHISIAVHAPGIAVKHPGLHAFEIYIHIGTIGKAAVGNNKEQIHLLSIGFYIEPGIGQADKAGGNPGQLGIGIRFPDQAAFLAEGANGTKQQQR